MINDKKGQALVEFILVLPIFLIILFLIIDFGRIFYNKIKMESIIDDTVQMYNSNKSYVELKNFVKKQENEYVLTVSDSNEYINFKITYELELSTPLLNAFMKNPYPIFTERVIYNE